MTRQTFDEQWPYQVATADDSDAADRAVAFCQRHDLSLRVMGASVTYEGRTWAVYCFSHHDDADLFRAELAGRWVHAYLWRREVPSDGAD